MRNDSSVRLFGAAFKTKLPNSYAAEFAAAANGVAAAVKAGLAAEGDTIVAVTDNQGVRDAMTQLPVAAKGSYGKYAAALERVLSENRLSLRSRWVKAHTSGKDRRSWVNRQVDKEAGRHMRAARDRLLGGEPHPTPADVFRSGTLAFHATVHEVDEFRPLSHFGTAAAAAARVAADWRRGDDGIVPGARTYPVLLDIQAPLELRDLGNHTSMDFAAALWERGLIDEAAAWRVVAAVAAAEKSESPDGWARSCSRFGLVDPALCLARPGDAKAAAAGIGAAAFADAFWRLNGSPAGLARAIRDCQFPRDSETCKAADGLVVEAIRAAGHDGVRYENAWEDAGSVSWVILEARQARVLSSTAGRAPSLARTPAGL
jgi:hypothetical protein